MPVSRVEVKSATVSIARVLELVRARDCAAQGMIEQFVVKA